MCSQMCLILYTNAVVLESAIPVVETHNAVSDDLDHMYSTIQDIHHSNDQQRHTYYYA